MAALEVLSKNWVNEDSLDKSVVSAIWDIVFMVPERLNYSFHNHNAMLKDEYLKYIEWLEAIARAAMCLASGMSYSEASLEYRELFEDSDVEDTIGRLQT